MLDVLGKILIAPPSLKDSFFERSVVFITEDHHDGSVGVVLNKPSTLSINEFASMNDVIINVPGYIYCGGPVNVSALGLIHTNDWVCDNTFQINEQFSISSSAEILSNFAMGYFPREWRMFVGMAGWSPGQLEDEIAGAPPYKHAQSWLIANPTLESVFELESQEQWQEGIALASSNFAHNILD